MKDYVYFSIENENTNINFTATYYVTNSEYDDEKKLYCEIPTNNLACYYNFNDKNEWGSVEDTISTTDIAKFSQLFDDLLNNKINEFDFETECHLFCCTAKHAGTDYLIDFKINDGLEDSWVQVVKEGLTHADIAAMANVRQLRLF